MLISLPEIQTKLSSWRFELERSESHPVEGQPNFLQHLMHRNQLRAFLGSGSLVFAESLDHPVQLELFLFPLPFVVWCPSGMLQGSGAFICVCMPKIVFAFYQRGTCTQGGLSTRGHFHQGGGGVVLHQRSYPQCRAALRCSLFSVQPRSACDFFPHRCDFFSWLFLFVSAALIHSHMENQSTLWEMTNLCTKPILKQRWARSHSEGKRSCWQNSRTQNAHEQLHTEVSMAGDPQGILCITENGWRKFCIFFLLKTRSIEEIQSKFINICKTNFAFQPYPAPLTNTLLGV